MPVGDPRRVSAPVETKPISCLVREKGSSHLENDSNFRKDGRQLSEIRPAFLRTGIVTQAKGSAYFETVGSKVVCAVYGPRDNPRKQEFSAMGKLTCDFSFAPFSRKERVAPRSQENDGQLYANLVVDTFQSVVCLETFPKAQVDIYIKVLEDSGNLTAHALLAASTALADAGIEMFGLLSACSAAFDDKHTLVDPTRDELNDACTVGTVTVGYVPALNQICCLSQDGCMSLERVNQGIKSCIEGSLRMHHVLQDALVSSVKRKASATVDCDAIKGLS